MLAQSLMLAESLMLAQRQAQREKSDREQQAVHGSSQLKQSMLCVMHAIHF